MKSSQHCKGTQFGQFSQCIHLQYAEQHHSNRAAPRVEMVRRGEFHIAPRGRFQFLADADGNRMRDFAELQRLSFYLYMCVCVCVILCLVFTAPIRGFAPPHPTPPTGMDRHIHIQIHAHPCVYICIYIYIYMCVCIYIYVFIYLFIDFFIYLIAFGLQIYKTEVPHKAVAEVSKIGNL